MRELVQIESPAEHACGQQPTVQRWEVLEPIAGRWSWMTVFHCCGQVAVEAAEENEKQVRKAA
ncbi:MAG: hypothetical protein JOZ81_23280 [Chloroflexi bacterium]|nr:hypothetical protein [Chloroflexota bacterium]MBV9546289.1 hypothetical protein [Chloroflexota bacterium]